MTVRCQARSDIRIRPSLDDALVAELNAPWSPDDDPDESLVEPLLTVWPTRIELPDQVDADPDTYNAYMQFSDELRRIIGHIPEDHELEGTIRLDVLDGYDDLYDYHAVTIEGREVVNLD